MTTTTDARYTVSRVGDTRVVTAYLEGAMHTTNDQNPNWNKILERLFENDTEGLENLFSAENMVRDRFKVLSERVSVLGGHVYFDGDPIDDVLSDHLLRLIHDGEDVSDLVAFWEKIASNPSDHSRVNLLRWLTAEDFSISGSGDIIGYKGVRTDLKSCRSGPGIVNGVKVNGNLDNTPGNLVEMGRQSVTHDPNQACSAGLHVGTWEYASGFGQVVVEVHVNPRDVVSVPTDCNGQKMRVCRYTVKRVLTEKYTGAVVKSDDDDFDADRDVPTDWNTTL